ncbi:MAG: hypothetical protein J6S63_05045, partial [Atopobiaceae bacterium]|nr:hypothetical protein [Atopobiaceae bacterium]
MSKKVDSQGRNMRKKTSGAKGVAKTLGLRCLVTIMTVSMVLSGDGVAYGMRAFAQTQLNSSGESAEVDEGRSATVVDSQDVDAHGDEPPSNDADASDGANESDEQAPVHDTLTGDLPVRLSFALDGVEAAPQAVTLKLQRRSQTWDASANEWSAIDESTADAGWSDVVDESTGNPVAVHLSADEVSTSAFLSYTDDDATNDGAAYTFTNLTVQTVTADGTYDTRYEYRAVVTNVDGAPEDVIGYNALLASIDGAARTQTYVVEAAKTSANVADYVVTVPIDATLRADGDSPQTDTVTVAEYTVAIEGTTVQPAEVPDAPADDASTEDGEEPAEGAEKSDEVDAEEPGEDADETPEQAGESDEQGEPAGKDETEPAEKPEEADEQAEPANKDEAEPADTSKDEAEDKDESADKGNAVADGADKDATTDAAETEPADAAEPADKDESDAKADREPASTETASATRDAAADKNVVTADLPVAVTFQKDGEEAGPYAISLQVQSRTQSWDASEEAWGELSAWENVEGMGVSLSAGDVLGAKDATYTFKDLEVQTNDDKGRPVTRTEYRVVQTMLAGAPLAYAATDDGVMRYTGEVTLDDVTYDIEAKVSDEAAAKAVDTKKGAAKAKVQTVQITNDLTERQTLLASFLGLFKTLGVGTNRATSSARNAGEGDTSGDEHPTATGDPVMTVNENEETGEVVSYTFTYTINNTAKNYADNGQIV